MKVVAIDDDPINLEIVKQVCAKLDGAEQLGFTDSELAICHLIQTPADLVIVDYSMPRITGIEVIKRLRASPRHQTTPIIMLTSSSEHAVRTRAREVGVTDFISKPFRPMELLARLKGYAAVPMPPEI